VGQLEKGIDEPTISRLAERFVDLVQKGKLGEFSEADVGSKFILPLFQALGWDTSNIDEVAEQRRTLTGPADYSLKIHKTPKLVVEIKKFTEDLDSKRVVRGKEESYPYQATRYAWHLKVDWCVLTNFRELRLYYAHTQKPEDGLQFKIHVHEFLGRDLQKLALLSKESIVTGRLDALEKRRTRNEVDREILETLYECRVRLVSSILKNHPDLALSDVRESVQRILDRILFTRVAEDRGIIGADSLWIQLESWRKRDLPTLFMKSLKSIFRELDDAYDSKLFERHGSEDLRIENDVLEFILSDKALYGYNFDLIDSDVLGAIYEDYIGHILADGEQGVRIVTSKTKRREGGIYYTPPYIVEYIMRATLGELLRNCKTPREIANLKILDPACGSGSFLIKAFDMLKGWYDEYNKQMVHVEWAKIDQISNVETKIITENLYGVDVDPQAAEIASVNLMLKALRKREKLPQILGTNIKVGDALVSPQELDTLSFKPLGTRTPFDWEEFSFWEDKKSVVIIAGNPPYVGIETIPNEDKLLYRELYPTFEYRSDVFSLFIERSIRLLRHGDMCGFIVPSRILNNDSYSKLRLMILNRTTIEQIVQLGTDVFKDAKNETMILILRKNEDENERNRHQIKIVTDIEDLQSKKYESYTIPQNLFLTTHKNMFNIKLKPEIAEVFAKITACSIRLSEIARANQGMRTGDNVKLIVEEKKSDQYKPIVRGKDIDRYFIDCPNLFVNYDPAILDAPRDEKIFTSREKLIVQEIRSINLERRVIAGYDDEKRYALQTTNVVNLLPNSPYSIKYLLAILNSELINIYFKTLWIDIHIKSEYLEQIPVARIDFGAESRMKHDRLVELVNKILELKKLYASIIDRFERYLAPVLDEVQLKFFYDKLAVSEKEIMGLREQGELQDVYIQEESDWLILLADYFKTEKGKKCLVSRVPILRLQLKEELVRKFLYYVLAKTKNRHGSGNIASKILETPIPRFSKDVAQNTRTIRDIMGTYMKAVHEKQRLGTEIGKIDSEIDKEIFQLYGLTPKEIEIIRGMQRD